MVDGRPVTVTVCGRPVTVVIRVEVTVFVNVPPGLVTVEGLPVTVTVLPGEDTVETLVEVI